MDKEIRDFFTEQMAQSTDKRTEKRVKMKSSTWETVQEISKLKGVSDSAVVEELVELALSYIRTRQKKRGQQPEQRSPERVAMPHPQMQTQSQPQQMTGGMTNV